MSAAAKLLNRLERVKATGPGRWIARCPAHEDRTPSLSVREGDSGALIKCFAGCEPGAVLAAIGLTFSDLFDRPLWHHFAPSRSQIPARDLLELIDVETYVVMLVAQDILGKRDISAEDFDRLRTAAGRIHDARDHLHGR